jgi:large repetitive protein
MAAQTVLNNVSPRRSLPGGCAALRDFGSRAARRVATFAAFGAAMAVAAEAPTNFGSVNVGASTTATVTLTIPATATLGSIPVVSQGATGLDFLNGGAGTCVLGMSYEAGQTCTVQVMFKPVFPGPRFGAVSLLDGAKNVIASALLEGNGVGPQIASGPGTTIAIAPMVNGIGFNNPFGVAVDGKGDLFVADSNNARVVELPVGGGAPVAIDPIVNGTGLSNPGGVMVDAAGNLYIADLDLNIVEELPANGGAPMVINPTVDGKQLRYPCGMAMDPAGNLYIADVDNARVVEVPASGGAAVVIDPLANGEKLSYPVTLALDNASDLFIADFFANRIVEVPAGGGTPTAIDPVVNGQGLDFPYGIAIDAAGDLLIADANNRVVVVPPGGGAPTAITPTVNGEGLNDPIGIALTGAGDLYIGDSLNNRVVELVRSQPPAVNFAASSTGTVSSDSPKTVAIENIGNASLTFPSLGTSNNPAISANFGLASGEASACPLIAQGSSQPASLAAGASCILQISFQPTASGTIYGALTLIDNTLNASAPAYATQTITLSGDAPVATVSASSLSFGSQQVNTASVSQQVTLTNTGSAALSISNISVTGTNAPAFVFPNPCGTSLAPGANCSISGHFTPGAAGAMTAAITVTDNASGAPQAITLTGTGVYPVSVSVSPNASSITTAQPLSVTVTVSGANGQPTPTGSVSITSGSYTSAASALISGSTTISIPAGSLPTGSDSIIAVYTPDNISNEVYASGSGSSSVTVTVASSAAAPAATTGSASTVNASSATLAGTVNPNGADTHTWFLYGTNSTLSGASQTPSQDVGSAVGTDSVNAIITGLSANTTYYYQAVAQNSVGTSNGAIGSFTTDPAAYFSVITGQPISLTPGATTGNTTTISVTPWYGFAGTVNLSCTITPIAANDPPTCNIPATASISGENATMVTLTVSTTATNPTSAIKNPARVPWAQASGAALACIVLLIAPMRRRWLTLLAWVVLFVAVGGVGCGGSGSMSSSGPPPNQGTSPGTYTVTITGVSGSMTETGTVALTVQ